MKKRLLLLAFTISAGLTLSACSKYNTKEVSLRDEGIALMDEDDYEGAIAKFDEALGCSVGKVTDLELDIDYYKAAAQYASGAFDDAVSTYTYLIKYDKTNYKPYFLRGSIYASEGEIGQAIKDYDAACQIDTKNYLLYIEIYNNLDALGYTDQGLVYLNNALAVSDKSAKGKYYKGRIYYMLGQTSDAQTYLQEAIDKDVVEAKLYLAKIYQDAGDYTTAQSLLEDYASSEEVTSDALGTLGDLELAEGNYENALGYYEAGLILDSIDNLPQLMKGKVAALEKLNRYDEALETITQYLDYYPSDEEAQKEQIFLQTR